MKRMVLEPRHKIIFCGGLHRSGTTALYGLLASDPRISTFKNTGATEDEGQYLQSVFPLEGNYGRVGDFALNPKAHWTETSEFIAPARSRLFHEWSRFWDLSKPILAEKTPANLIRTRFLREVFPNCGFLLITRHPVAVVLAATKWRNTSAEKMLKNWLTAHRIMRKDLQDFEDYVVLRYEEISTRPQDHLEAINSVVGFATEFDLKKIKSGLNEQYYARWRAGDFHLWPSDKQWKNSLKSLVNRSRFKLIERVFESQVREFGYSFGDIYEYVDKA